MNFHPPQPVALYVTWSVAAALSVLCYAWLLRALRQNLTPIARERLFPRQLRSLAMSGMVLHLSSMPLIWMRFKALERGSLLHRLMCTTFVALRVSSYWTVFQETHMVLTFLAQVMHWTTALAVLNRSFLAMWLLGILLGLCDPNSYKCDEEGKTFFLVGIATSFCSAISILSGLSMLCMVARGKCPGRASQNFIRAAVFSLIAPTCYAMMLGAVFQPRFWYSPEWYYPLSGTLKFSNGWINTLAYALQSRYASRLLGRCNSDRDLPDVHGDVRDFASLGVTFGGVDIEDVLPWERKSLEFHTACPCSSASWLPWSMSRDSSRGGNGTSQAPEPAVFLEGLYS